MAAIMREKRIVDVSFQMSIPETHLTDEQLEQHIQGVANVLFVMLGGAMSAAPLPHQPVTYVVAKVKKGLTQQ